MFVGGRRCECRTSTVVLGGGPEEISPFPSRRWLEGCEQLSPSEGTIWAVMTREAGELALLVDCRWRSTAIAPQTRNHDELETQISASTLARTQLRFLMLASTSCDLTGVDQIDPSAEKSTTTSAIGGWGMDGDSCKTYYSTMDFIVVSCLSPAITCSIQVLLR